MKLLCPTCRSPRSKVERGSPHFPFCCQECRDRDLARWVREEYRIDAGPAPSVDGDGRLDRDGDVED